MLEIQIVPAGIDPEGRPVGQAVATESGAALGSAAFVLDGGQMVIGPVLCGEDDALADGLIRSCLNWGERRQCQKAVFAPSVDRAMLRRLYHGAADFGIEDVRFFFASCKNCEKF